MAVATLPVLGGYTLAAPVEQGDTLEIRGGTLRMASGRIIHDIIDATPRHRFQLRWVYLTFTQLEQIGLAWATVMASTATYTTIRGISYTVTRPEGGELDVTPVVTAGGDIKYHVTMELVEDS